jgi:hypothetical protein
MLAEIFMLRLETQRSAATNAARTSTDTRFVPGGRWPTRLRLLTMVNKLPSWRITLIRNRNLPRVEDSNGRDAT